MTRISDLPTSPSPADGTGCRASDRKVTFDRSGDPSRLRSTMMPVSLLIALLIAFGIEPPATGVPQADVGTRVLETFGGIIADREPGVRARVLGRVSGVSHRVHDLAGSASRYALGVRLITFLSLVVYGWIIHSVGWSKLVRTNWGWIGLILVDDVVVFLPFLLIQLLVWWGLFFAERALQIRAGNRVQTAGWADTWF